MKNTVLYIYGKGGAFESEHYKPFFPCCDVIGWTARLSHLLEPQIRADKRHYLRSEGGSYRRPDNKKNESA